MSKFKIKLKLQGLELEVEGSKEDIPLIANNVAAQLGGLIAPASDMAEGSDPLHAREPINVTPALQANGDATPRRRRSAPRRNGGATSAGNGEASPEVFDWRHDANTWGSPSQEWSPVQKAVWMLFVAGKQNVTQEMTTLQVGKTFNKHFRQAGLLIQKNLARDLRKGKQTPAKLSEDTTQNPPRWFLTDEGNKYAELLVRAARGETVEL